MHVFTEKPIREAKEKWPRAANALEQWYRLAKGSNPGDFAAMKSIFPATDKVGEFQNHLRVYDRGGEDCRVCSGKIKRIALGNRSAFYCPSCQK